MPAWTGHTKPITAVGLIGCGTMGKGMLSRLVDRGYRVRVFDPSLQALEFARGAGAETAASPGDLARDCSLILLSLPGPPQIEEVLFGGQGVFHALGPEHLIIDTSTVDPACSRSAAARVAEKGAAYLDCPILGRPQGLGNWMICAGGDENALDYARPVLLAFAAKAVLVGPQGSGNILKLLNQLMFSAINGITSEVLAIADKAGIGKEVFYSVVAESSAATVSGLFKEVGRTIVNDSFDQPNFSVDLLIKDAGLALQMAEEAGAPSAIAGQVQAYNKEAALRGLGSEDTAALYKVFAGTFSREE
ncbi:MAG: NAD(P)-dependent oxidoreductase [Treponema sp.]|nr:NAD(P)-dependent oxidoreductase [Treponema sp.]